MRSTAHPHQQPSGAWQPPGNRWGLGARSVLPYLNHSVQAKLMAVEIAAEDEGPVRNPVFREMLIRVRM